MKPMPKRLREQVLAAHGIAHRPIDLTTHAQIDKYLRLLERRFKIRTTLQISRGSVHVIVTQSWWGRLFDRAHRACDTFTADGARHGVAVCDYTANTHTAGIFWPSKAT